MRSEVVAACFGLLMLPSLLAGAGCDVASIPAPPGERGIVRPVGSIARPVYLTDLYEPLALIDRIKEGLPTVEPTEWRFEDAGDAAAWSASDQVADLARRDGALTGRSTGVAPLLRVEHTAPVAAWDSVHAVEVTARVSAGASIGVHLVGPDDIGFERVAETVGSPFAFSDAPIRAGKGFQTVAVPIGIGIRRADQARFLYVRPTDAADAEFAVRSVRLILRSEYLASMPSGAGRYALDEVYRDALLLRSGEEIQLEAQVPERGRLELSVGTMAPGATIFRIDLSGGALRTQRAIQHTVTTPNRWERVVADLSAFSGQLVRLRLSQHSDNPSAVGLLGSPTVRTAKLFESGRPRTVIFILADTLRRDHLDLHGHGRETAPWLRRLASEGAIFLDVVSQASWTKASAPSILTSLYPSTHGVRGFADRLPKAAVTLAETFRDEGYSTVGFSSVLFTGKFTNLQQGYDAFHEFTSVREPGSKTSREYVDRLLTWLAQHRDVPTFAFLHVFDPHDPFEPREPYASRWVDDERREIHAAELEKVRPKIALPLLRERGLANVEELQSAGINPVTHVRMHQDWYDASIRAMDDELSRIGEGLHELGLANDAMIVFTSDHGEEFHDHGGVFHGSSLYAELLSVPLVVWAPGRVASGTRVEATTQSIDIMPTLLELSGIDAPSGVQGRSLVPVIRGVAGAGSEPFEAFAEKARQDATGAPSPPQPELEATAIVSGRWKLVHNTNRPDGRPEYELFDREVDPLERINLANSLPDEVERLAGRLDQWREEVNAVTLPKDNDPAAVLTPGELERLRALGYAP